MSGSGGAQETFKLGEIGNRDRKTENNNNNSSG